MSQLVPMLLFCLHVFNVVDTTNINKGVISIKRHYMLITKLTIALFFIVLLVINYLNQSTISTIAQINKPFIQPANFTFSIWSIIYGWFLCWIIYSFFKGNTHDKLYMSVRYLLPLNFTFNCLWVLSFASRDILLSCLFIILVLITCVYLFINAKRYAKLGWFITGVFSIYLGWISIATIVNIFYYVNNLTPSVWSTFEQIIYTALMLIIVLLYAIYILVRASDIILPLTLVWALIGIALNGLNQFISLLSFSFATIIAIAIVIKLIKQKKSSSLSLT